MVTFCILFTLVLGLSSSEVEATAQTGRSPTTLPAAPSRSRGDAVHSDDEFRFDSKCTLSDGASSDSSNCVVGNENKNKRSSTTKKRGRNARDSSAEASKSSDGVKHKGKKRKKEIKAPPNTPVLGVQ